MNNKIVDNNTNVYYFFLRVIQMFIKHWLFGPYWTLQDLIGTYWTLLDLIGTYCTWLKLIAQDWNLLDLIRPYWNLLHLLDLIWTYLNLLDLKLNFLNWTERTLKKLKTKWFMKTRPLKKWRGGHSATPPLGPPFSHIGPQIWWYLGPILTKHFHSIFLFPPP